jgi:rSAM/selenodomain-associated transferase 1
VRFTTCEPFWLAVRIPLVSVKLIVVAKEPLPGRVKTRLTPPFSPEQAAELATAAIADTLNTVEQTVSQAQLRGMSVEPILVLDGVAGPWLWPLCTTERFRVLPQRGGDLDARLAAAFDDATGSSPGMCAVLVGMDTPQLTPALLLDAFSMLTSPGNDAVLGLAEDGGWWGLGLRKPDPALLLGVPMSTSHTGRDQYVRLLSFGLRVGLLPVLRDVDDAGDAAHVAAVAPHSRFAAAFSRIASALPVAS